MSIKVNGVTVAGRGYPGPAGADGKSPYQVAVEEGYTGTQSEFNSALAGIAEKADRVVPSAAGNLAALGADGSLQDSGKKTTDFASTSHQHSAGDIASGTLPVSRGGTGTASFTSGYALIGSGTGPVTVRRIDHLSSPTDDLSGGTEIITAGTLCNMINRNSSVSRANTEYTKLMARGCSLNSSETFPDVNGAIAWQYE